MQITEKMLKLQKTHIFIMIFYCVLLPFGVINDDDMSCSMLITKK